MIRHANTDDASRIAEILVFTKRMNYRRIFHDDRFSFCELQVYPLAKSFIEEPRRLTGFWVYDDEFVKGVVHIEGKEIRELYVDTFFENQGIGSRLIDFAVGRGCEFLWVLEKNDAAIRFYRRHGFELTDERKRQGDTTEYIVKMFRKSGELSQ